MLWRLVVVPRICSKSIPPLVRTSGCVVVHPNGVALPTTEISRWVRVVELKAVVCIIASHQEGHAKGAKPAKLSVASNSTQPHTSNLPKPKPHS